MRSCAIGLCLVFEWGCAARAPDLGRPEALAVPAPTRVELVEAGRNGSAPLRYLFAVGTTQKLQVSSDVSLSIEAGNLPLVQSQGQRMVLEAQAEITAVEPSGAAHVWVKVTRAELQVRTPLASGDALKKQVDALENQTAELVVDERGRIIRASERFDRIPGALLELVALPEEPVGDQARWRALGEKRVNGVLADRRAEYELVSRTSVGLVVRGNTTLTGVKQTVTRNGQAQEVEGLNADARFESTVDLHHPFAARQSSGSVALRLILDGNRVTLTTTVRDEVAAR